jgi:hypothetical protein
MSIEETDLRNAEFMQKLRARDFAGAHESLDRLASKHGMRDSAYAGWKAHICRFEGRVSEAVDLLTPHIERDDLSGKFMRHQRARLYLSAGMVDEALSDLWAVATDATPRVVEAMRTGTLFEIACIYATRGDPEFENVCDLIPDGHEQYAFAKEEILRKDELQKLYGANQKQYAHGRYHKGERPKR